jgi:hypothetical protein
MVCDARPHRSLQIPCMIAASMPRSDDRMIYGCAQVSSVPQDLASRLDQRTAADAKGKSV